MQNNDHISPNVGAMLRQMRQERGLSLDETARLTGVSKAMLGQIERGESNPTISTMWKIASGLKVTFSALMGDTSATYSAVRLEELLPMLEVDGKMKLYNVFPFNPIVGFEYFYITLEPGCRYSSPGHENVSEEYIVVTKGTLELTVGQQVFLLETGDSIKFRGMETHVYANPTDEETIFQNIMKYQS